MKKTLLACTLILALGSVQAAEVHCEPAVSTAAFVVDVSGSMMQELAAADPAAAEKREAEQKILLARKVLTELFPVTVKEGLRTSLFTVAPYTNQLPLAQYSAEDFAKALEKLNPRLEAFGRPTWVGTRAQDRFNTAVGASQAVILFTDGGFVKKVKDPVETIKAFYAANPQACVHFVSAARTEAEKAGVQELAALKACSQVIDLERAAKDAKARADFTAHVFPENCTPVTKAPAPAVLIQGVNFDFDKDVLTAEARTLLDHAVEVIKTRAPDERIHIIGWTDYFGSDVYNAGLSRRRAAAVRAYLISKGVAASRISDEGKGKSFRYSNESKHGRWQNRRVDLILGDGAVVSKDAQ